MRNGSGVSWWRALLLRLAGVRLVTVAHTGDVLVLEAPLRMSAVAAEEVAEKLKRLGMRALVLDDGFKLAGVIVARREESTRVPSGGRV